MGDTYELDFLVSIEAITSHGILTAEEGMRQLRQRAQNSNISPIRALLRVEPQELVITDVTTGADTEHISLNLVSQPAAIISRGEKFNNVLTFVVLEDSYKFVPPEMHLFQCIDKSVS